MQLFTKHSNTLRHFNDFTVLRLINPLMFDESIEIRFARSKNCQPRIMTPTDETIVNELMVLIKQVPDLDIKRLLSRLNFENE